MAKIATINVMDSTFLVFNFLTKFNFVQTQIKYERKSLYDVQHKTGGCLNPYYVNTVTPIQSIHKYQITGY